MVDPFKLSDDLWLYEQAAYLPKLKALVVSDLQLGHEQHLREHGASVLLEQGKLLLLLLDRLVTQSKARRLIIDGDLKHEFGKTSFSERRDLLTLLRHLQKRVDIIVVRGNHDTMTKPLVDELGIPFVEYWSEGGFYVVHGNKEPVGAESVAAYKAAKTVIIGHVHPAVNISDGVRKERYKCFLLGTYRKKRLLVLPSCSTVVEGSDILQGAMNSPFLQGIDSSMVYVLADEIRSFGKVADLRRILG